MSAVARLRAQVDPLPRSAMLLAVVLAIAVGGLAPGASAVRADQTVYFDDAGSAPHISLIGDSTLTGVRWYADYGALQRFNFVLSAESCRRTIEQSCISREGYRSANVVTAMRSLDGDLGEVLVVMSGYNDPVWTIDEAIAGVVDEARRQGVAHVVWLTLRTSVDVGYSDPQQQTGVDTFRDYNEQLVASAAASDGYLQVADWATYSDGASEWFEADGVHLTPRGVDAVTTFVAGTVERVIAGEDVTPSAAPWTVLVPGAEGEIVAAVQAALIASGIELRGGADGVYGNDTMAAVAEYQRRHDSLQVTGAVDAATARSLGVHEDPAAPEPATSTTSPARSVAVTSAPPNAVDTAGGTTASTGGDSGRSMGSVLGVTAVPVVVLGVVILAVLARRRRVVARRRARRWARVHPSASPLRSVADMRRAGELPSTRGGQRPIDDRRLGQPTMAATAEPASHTTGSA
jgi:peptidoglycan hydrolase-like protein with peptidoglycan-binding domain